MGILYATEVQGGGLRYSLTDVRQGCPFESFPDSGLHSYAEGPMSVDPPLEATEVRFISSGRILKDCERVQGTVGNFYLFVSAPQSP